MKPTVAVAKKPAKSSSDSDSSDANEKKSSAVVANKPKVTPVAAKKPAPSSSSSDSDDEKVPAKPVVKGTVPTGCIAATTTISFCSYYSSLGCETGCYGNTS